MKFIIEDSFWEIFPEAKIGIIVGRGLNNTYKDMDFFESLLRASEKTAVARLGSGNLTEHPDVATWREAFTKFKTKKGARSSIEALLKRVAGGTELRCINPLVDLYNSISLKYGLPCGGEDIDKFSGDLRLSIADGSEHFVPIGQEESSPPNAGEIIYKDDDGAVCRCWNWREAERTMLTKSTQNAFLCIEIPDGSRQVELETAIDELAQHVIENLGGCCQYFVLDKESRTFYLGGDNE